MQLIFESGIGTGKLHLTMNGHGVLIHIGMKKILGFAQLQFMILCHGGLNVLYKKTNND